MKKTASEVINDLYSVVKDSPLADTVKGAVYKGGTRPQNALSEDIVIDFLSGTVAQIQEGIVNLEVYVPDVNGELGSQVCDVTRCSEIENVANVWVEQIQGCDHYQLTLDEMICTKPVKDSKHHVVSVRLKFNYITF